MFNYLKYDLMGRPLELYKAHDFCASKEPKLTVILIHGIAADSSSFNRALEYLEGTQSMKDVRFVAFDLLGAGKSYTSDKLEYNFEEQLEALNSSITKLNLKTPVVLVGHSMGTLIATRFADKHRRMVKELVLISPPIYRPEDIENPIFEKAMEGFRAVMRAKDKEIVKTKAFNNEIINIVSNPRSYKFLVEMNKPVTIIYGDKDEVIGRFNIPKLLEENTKIEAIKTLGTHGVSHNKYAKVLEVLERILNETV